MESGSDCGRTPGRALRPPGAWRAARRVARYAHRKALGMTPPASGVRRFTWHGWRVTGDLRRQSDWYKAARRGSTVRWAF